MALSDLDIIYCASGNKRFAQIAIDAGFKYGSRLPATTYFQPYFVDQDYKNPNREKYMKAVSEWKPYMATVLDWQREDQFNEVMDWAEEVSQHVELIIIIPKILGTINHIPKYVNQKPVRLGFSYPSTYGSASFSILDEMIDWPNGVHILGGSPEKQMMICQGKFKYPRKRTKPTVDFLMSQLDIRSIDGNYMQLMATRYNQFWCNGDANYASNPYWPRLDEDSKGRWGDGTNKADAPYEAFRRSCQNIIEAWSNLKTQP